MRPFFMSGRAYFRPISFAASFKLLSSFWIDFIRGFCVSLAALMKLAAVLCFASSVSLFGAVVPLWQATQVFHPAEATDENTNKAHAARAGKRIFFMRPSPR